MPLSAWRTRGLVALVAGLALLATTGPDLLVPHAAAQGGLFTPTGRRPTAPAPTVDGTIVRARYVEVNFALLDGSARAPMGTPGPSDSALALDLFPAEAALFPAVSLNIVREGLQPTSSGQGYVWLGRVQGAPDSQVTLVAENGVLVGNIRTPGAYYQVRYAGVASTPSTRSTRARSPTSATTTAHLRACSPARRVRRARRAPRRTAPRWWTSWSCTRRPHGTRPAALPR